MQGGIVVNAEGETMADVLIMDGIIEAVQANLTVRTPERVAHSPFMLQLQQ